MSALGQGSYYQPMDLNQSQQNRNSKISEFWTKIMIEINKTRLNGDKHHELPMARIKKIMKMDDSVQNCMIGSEAPVLIAKACEIFIRELTLLAWMHTEDNKRRTLQKNDIIAAVGSNEMYDFLIDIIPREESLDFAHQPDGKVPYDQVLFSYVSYVDLVNCRTQLK